MKIDSNLRAALKSICNNQTETALSWEADKRSVAGFLKANPKIEKRLKLAQASYEKAKDEFHKLGLRTDYSIMHREDFSKASGIKYTKKLSFDRLMQQLALAEPNEGEAILAELGIKWK